MNEFDGDVIWEDHFDGFGEDWDVIEQVLPDGWQEAARRTGALRRTHGFKDAETLLRVLLIHLVDGCSLRETAVRADAGGLIKVSDVALLGRLRGSGEWFRWMAEKMSRRLSTTSHDVLPGKRVRLVDASVVCEPGATGSTWRLHYMLDLSTLACEQLLVTLPEEGETLTRFTVQANDVVMADRGLAHRRGIRHVVNHQGDVIVRMNMVSVPLDRRRIGRHGYATTKAPSPFASARSRRVPSRPESPKPNCARRHPKRVATSSLIRLRRQDTLSC